VYGIDTAAQVEPPFMPSAPWTLVQLESNATGKCLFAERSPGTYGKLMAAESKGKCTTAAVLGQGDTHLHKIHERQTWQWHYQTGYVRPAIREPGRIYCLDSRIVTKNPNRNGPSGVPMVNVCHPNRNTQKWVLKSVSNGHTLGGADAVADDDWGSQVQLVAFDSQCMEVTDTTGTLGFRDCESTKSEQIWTLRRFEHTTHGLTVSRRT
jgi:hypothetical protein